MDFFHFSARLLSCHLLYFYFAINKCLHLVKAVPSRPGLGPAIWAVVTEGNGAGNPGVI